MVTGWDCRPVPCVGQTDSDSSTTRPLLPVISSGARIQADIPWRKKCLLSPSPERPTLPTPTYHFCLLKNLQQQDLTSPVYPCGIQQLLMAIVETSNEDTTAEGQGLVLV